MWKIAFCLGMMFSLGASANVCDIKNIEGIAALIKSSPEEKHYRETYNRLLELRYKEETRRSMPEFSAGFEVDKDKTKNQELTAELLFSIDEFRKYQFREKLAKASGQLEQNQFTQKFNERLNESLIAFFKISQDEFFLNNIDKLLSTIHSSENIYQKRPIKSRDDEIILNSLGLIKNNLYLKKSKIEDRISESRTTVKKWGLLDCSIPYSEFVKMIDGLKVNSRQESDLLTQQALKLKFDTLSYSYDLDSRKLFTNLKVGPSFTREVIEGSSELRFGVSLSFDIPSFNSNSSYLEEAKVLSRLESQREVRGALLEKESLEMRFQKYSDLLKNIPSIQSLETNVKKIKKSFDSGVVSPLVYLDSYRSFTDYLESSEEIRLSAFESYLKLRGIYVENNSL